MRLLVDTQLLIWAAEDDGSLPAAAHALMATGRPVFSAVSIWEVAIKRNLGRHDLSVSSRALHRGLLASGYTELPVTGEHATLVENLPLHHRDPFDRILVAQALCEGIPLLTADRVLALYPGDIRVV